MNRCALFFAAMVIASCDVVDVNPPRGSDPASVPYPTRLFYSQFTYTPYEKDADGIVWLRWGESYTYHPVYMLRVMLYHLERFEETENRLHLARASMYLEKLVDEAEVIDGLSYLAYRFNHLVTLNPEETDWLVAPWFSGMAQGVAVSVSSRIYAHTGDTRYLHLAHDLAETITVNAEGRPALSHIDDEGYYWIDEYPHEYPNLVLNGFIIAAFGLYDLSLITSDGVADLHWQRALQTFKRYIPDFRVPGGISLYGLRDGRQIEWYHRFHIELFRGLFAITDDEDFLRFADEYLEDFDPDG